MDVLIYIDKQPKLGFNQLKLNFPDITQSRLALILKTLEKKSLIKKNISRHSPIKTEYIILDNGEKVLQILEQL